LTNNICNGLNIYKGLKKDFKQESVQSELAIGLLNSIKNRNSTLFCANTDFHMHK